MTNKMFNHYIEADGCGMTESKEYHSIEDIYQALKERLIEEGFVLKVWPGDG